MPKDFIYGRHPVFELLQHGSQNIQRILLVTKSPWEHELQKLAGSIPIEHVSRQSLDTLLEGAVHQGIAAQIKSFQYAELQTLLKATSPRLVVALDQIQDPHNLGALVRSAFALGASGIVYAKDRSCDVTPVVVKASAGATVHLPIARVTNLVRAIEDLKKEGFWVVGTVAAGGKPLQQIDFKGDIVLVIGSEGEGLRRSVLEACDFHAHIPMSGAIGSLNASVAGAICLYEAFKQRQQ